MHKGFRKYVESLHPSFERLMATKPERCSTLPKSLPKECVYLFSEGKRHLYVGRTRNLRDRLGQHSRPSARQNEAVFAFKLAREMTGQTKAAYNSKSSRPALAKQRDFRGAFAAAKARVREMNVRFVEEADPLRQALLEMYVAIALKTPYNDFETH